MHVLKFFRLLGLVSCFVVLAQPCDAKVFYSKEEALKLAFGEQATVETLSLFPTDEQAAQIEQLAKVKLESKLFTFYVGKQQGVIQGYAAIESHTVRTQSETLLILLDVNGNLRNVVTLVFHEPPDYQPPERWFAQLIGHTLEQLSFDRDVQAVAGATLSTRAALNSARKVLAIFQVMIHPNPN